MLDGEVGESAVQAGHYDPQKGDYHYSRSVSTTVSIPREDIIEPHQSLATWTRRSPGPPGQQVYSTRLSCSMKRSLRKTTGRPRGDDPVHHARLTLCLLFYIHRLLPAMLGGLSCWAMDMSMGMGKCIAWRVNEIE